MIARALRELRRRGNGTSPRRSHADRGLTLVELLIAMTLTLILSGVLVAAIITSLRVASATSDNLKSSVDVGLVSSYLARDAQGAGGTDPNTTQKSSIAGVSTSANDWGGCTQAGATLVVRFTWVDHIDIRNQRVVTVTWGLAGSDLNRQYCEDGQVKTVVRLGRTLTSAVAACDTACSGTPTSVSLTVAGSNGESNYTTTMSASLRPRGQDFPTTGSASTVTFLALGNGSPTPCTNVALGTAKAYVIGDAVVNVNTDACAATALTPGTSSIVQPAFGSPAVTGSTSLTASLVDPLATTPAPTDSCGGSNPALGTPGVYPDKLTITSADGAVVFATGTYIFCKGLEIQAGASVVSKGGVFLYLKGGTLTIDPAASVEMSAITTGIDQRNIVVWVATKQTVSIGTGAHVTRLGGTIYAPTSDVVFTGDTKSAAINVGVLIAATVTINDNVPLARFGPIPTLSISPTVLSDSTAGDPYEAQLSLVGDGAAQMVNPRWSATDLSPYTINPVTGLISGTAPCSAVLTPHVRVVDDTGLAVSADYSIVVGSDLTLGDPGNYVRGTVNLVASLVATCGGEGTSVTIQYALSGADANGDGEPDWADICTTTVAPYTCAWVTTDPKYLGPDDNGNLTVDGTTFDLRAIATLPSGAKSTSETVGGVTVDNTTPIVSINSAGAQPLHGTVTLTTDAVDGETGIKYVKFEVSPAGAGAWMDACSTSAPFDPANQSLYGCSWDTTSFVPDAIGTVKYDIRALGVDLAGNVGGSSLTNQSINNNGASISIDVLDSYIRGTVTLTSRPFVPSPATVTSVTIRYKATGGSWTDICTKTSSAWTCSWDTTARTDGAYSVQAVMVDSRNITTKSCKDDASDCVSTNIDNSTFYGKDVQASNNHYQKKAADRTHPTTWFLEKFGKVDPIDTMVLTYSKSVKPSSLIAGWDGSERSIFVRIIDGQFLAMKASTTAKVLDLMDFCTSWDTGTKTGMQCSGTGTASNPNLGKGTGLGYVQMNADFVDGWDNTASKRKAAILNAKISVSGASVILKVGYPCLTKDWYLSGSTYYCVTASAKATGSPKDSKTPNKKINMVWMPSASALANDSFNTPSSTRPGVESGGLDRDF